MSELRRSFTLIEVLIAIALMVALVGTMFGFLFNMLASRARVLEAARRMDAAGAVIRQLDADLMACVVGDATNGAGVSGDQTSLRVLTRGVAAALAQQGPDDPTVFGDLQRAEYRFDEPARRVEGGRAAASDGPVHMVALDGVISKLRFRYHDGLAWRDSFDSRAEGRLPLAVEIAIWFNPLPGQEQATDDEQQADAGRLAAAAPEPEAPAAFDEERFAWQSDAASRDEPAPDRLRVFLIPDAQAEPDAAGDEERAE
jgi:type II secretory pathway pseudopilin PulG